MKKKTSAKTTTTTKKAKSAKPKPVTIRGVVAALGAGAGMAPGDKKWSMSCELEAWGLEGEPLRKELLTLEKLVGEKQLDALGGELPAFGCVRLVVRLSDEKSKKGLPRSAELERVLGTSTSADVRAFAAALKKPVRRKLPGLGTLTLDRRVDSFDGDVAWAKKKVRIRLGGRGGEVEPAAIATARALLRAQTKWTKKVGDYAVKKLLKLKNGTWLDDGQSAFTPQAFAGRLTLRSIDVNKGSFDFYFDDGDLFWGHTIVVSGTLKKGPIRADLFG